jgi:site-specific recombinase XerD
MNDNASEEPVLTSDAVEAFIADLRQQAVQLNTRKAYAHDLHLFLQEAPTELSQISPTVVDDFLARFPTPATRRRRSCSLHAFYHWLLQHEIVTTNPLAGEGVIPQTRGHPTSLPPETVAAILGVIPPTHLRDRTLFTLLYETGISVSEALGLLVSEVDLTPGKACLHVVGRKRHERTVLLTTAPVSMALLQALLHQQRLTSGSLFRGDPRHGGSAMPLEYSVVHYAWQKYCLTAGIA